MEVTVSDLFGTDPFQSRYEAVIDRMRAELRGHSGAVATAMGEDRLVAMGERHAAAVFADEGEETSGDVYGCVITHMISAVEDSLEETDLEDETPFMLYR